jgi:uncharacterized protein (TIGR00661 family)
MERNTVSPMMTLFANVARQMVAWPLGHLASAMAIRWPQAVLSDFEPWTAGYARMLGLPLIAVDNVHFMNHCMHPSRVVADDRQAAALMYPIVANMVPHARHYLVTTFASAPVRDNRTTLHLPILRPEILTAPRSIGNHVVVYFNDKADHVAIARTLGACPSCSFRVYGSKLPPGRYGNLDILPMSDDFMRDMAASKAVIGGAGFTLMTEAIYLGKPMLAVPFGGQFEQILNANYLELRGYGERARDFSPETVSGFLSRADGYRANLSVLKHDGNAELFGALDSVLEQVRAAA